MFTVDVKQQYNQPRPPSQKKIIHLCIILQILVQSNTVNDLILFGGHCDLYIMVQRFCLVSVTISNRKTSYRSLKQTAGSTILVHVNPLPSRGFTWNIKSYFLWKTMKKYLWMLSAAVVIGTLRVNKDFLACFRLFESVRCLLNTCVSANQITRFSLKMILS